MTGFEEFETDALIVAAQTINARVTGDIVEGKADSTTCGASEKLGRILTELKSRKLQG